MSQSELVKRAVGVLQDAGIEYMVTGSWASSLLGVPRATHDVDLVVALSSRHVAQLMAAFPPPDYYLDQKTIEEAIRNKSMFNVIAVKQGDKIDFWMLTDEPFNRSRFSRRHAVTLDGTPLQVSSPEDTILAKLRWAKLLGGSEKQLTDILGVYETQHPQLDMNYLNHWVKELGVEVLWQRVQAEAKVPGGEA